MRSLIARALVISSALIACMLLFSSIASASIPKPPARNTSSLDLPERVFALPGCEAHRKAYQQIYIGMDFKDVRDITTSLADPQKEVIRASAEDTDDTNITIVWTWRNERTDDGILIEEVSELRVRILQYKVVAITFDYDWRSPETAHEESRSKASRSFAERKLDPKLKSEKK